MKMLILVPLLLFSSFVSAQEQVEIKAGDELLPLELNITYGNGHAVLEDIRVYTNANGLTYFLAVEADSGTGPLDSICSQVTGARYKSAEINYRGLRKSVVELQWNLSHRGVVLYGDKRGRLVGANWNLAANNERNDRIMALDSIICTK